VLNFLARRFVTGLVTLFVALFLMYMLVDIAIDPLADLRESTAPNKAQLIAQRTEMLELETSAVVRFFGWFGSLFTGDLGVAWRTGESVTALLGHAIVSTLELITAATLLSLVVGVTVGIVSALRQYSAFDYTIILASFFFYSLPSFWVAVLLKQWGAIGFNDFLRDPVIATPLLIVLSLLVGLLWMLAVGGDTNRRMIVWATAAAATFVVLLYMQVVDWWRAPHIGLVFLALFGVAAAFAIVLVFAGLHNRRALGAALSVAALGLALYYPLLALFRGVEESHLLTAGLGVVALLVGWGTGRAWGGPDWRVSARVGAAVAVVMGILIFVDQVLRVWVPYSQALGGRPIPTFGNRTPGLGGNYWVQVLDSWMHLILPTVALVLIAFAAYTRYARASMLEVLNQDYIRTARAKGLPERVVVVKHGFRNALIPLATVVPIDVITLLGGAVITEYVFNRPGMGQLFIGALDGAEIDPVMGYLMITAALAIIANIVADLIYAAIDPRIRLNV
jgi:peptide/nickel transport system permease protein